MTPRVLKFNRNECDIYVAKKTPITNSAELEHFVYHETLLTSFIMLLSRFVQHSFIHWYQNFLAVHHVPKYISYHEVTGGLLTTWKAHSLSF